MIWIDSRILTYIEVVASGNVMAFLAGTANILINQ